ncbi:MAG: hypothetical protein ACNA8H_14290, partial [Anaerolineales bacterium]
SSGYYQSDNGGIMSEIMEQLKRCKKKLEEAEREKVVIETKISGYMDQLKELGYKNEKEATQALVDMEIECNKLVDKLEERIHEFESKYATILE